MLTLRATAVSLFIATGLLFVAILAGCAGENIPAAEPEQPRIEAREMRPDGSIYLVGAETWTLVGDTYDRPVELVPVRTDTIAVTRLIPGKWRAEALMSFGDDVKILVAGVEVARVSVVTYHVRFELMEIMIAGAPAIGGDSYGYNFDGGSIDVGATKEFVVSWIDHGNTEIINNPRVPVLWTVPAGLRIEIVGKDGREVRITGTSIGTHQLLADVAGKVVTINIIVPKD